jgi:microcompartment protein CcmL/EutN
MTAIGVVETNSIPLGVLAGDQMVKTAAVDLVSAQTSCPGKYIVVVSGEVAAVKAAVVAGVLSASSQLVDSLVIPNVDERVLAAMMGAPPVGQPQALGGAREQRPQPVGAPQRGAQVCPGAGARRLRPEVGRHSSAHHRALLERNVGKQPLNPQGDLDGARGREELEAPQQPHTPRPCTILRDSHGRISPRSTCCPWVPAGAPAYVTWPDPGLTTQLGSLSA